jgi:hypothetical protein
METEDRAPPQLYHEIHELEIENCPAVGREAAGAGAVRGRGKEFFQIRFYGVFSDYQVYELERGASYRKILEKTAGCARLL